MLAIALGTVAVAAAACSGGSGGCAQTVPLPQQVTLLYPMPNSTNVSDPLGTVLYASSPSVTIALGSASGLTPAQPAVLPSPLPTPIANPPAGSQVFAARVTSLRAATTYSVVASALVVSCDATQQYVPVTIGSFTTR